LATDLQAALDNPQVRAIVLNIDSPGGEASGISELADMVYAARDRKRIVAYIGGTGASAAYWIASAASEVVINDTGIAGSIGAALEVRIRAEEEGGDKRYEIVSRNAPNKRPDLSTEAGRAKIAETIDAMGDVFAAKVGAYLGVQPDDVPAMGDHGGLKVGAAAVTAGLAHRLGALEPLITELASPAATQRKLSMTIVRTTAELHAAIATGADPKTIQIAAAESVNVDAIKTEATAAGAKAERERINGINALAAKGFEKEVAAAIEQGTSVEATALTLIKAAQDRGISLAGIKSDAAGTSGANPPDGDEAVAQRKTAVTAIVAGATRR
jgi:ClpP class serine protease